MKVTITEVPTPKPPRVAIIELTEQEARDVRKSLGKESGGVDGILYKLFRALIEFSY